MKPLLVCVATLLLAAASLARADTPQAAYAARRLNEVAKPSFRFELGVDAGVGAESFLIETRSGKTYITGGDGRGLIYGALIYVAMFYFIVPVLSAAQGWKTPQGFWRNLGAANGHGFFVGLPIACAARYFLGRRAS